MANRLVDPGPTYAVELRESEQLDIFTWVLLLEASSRDALAGDHSDGVPSVLAWLVRRCAAHPPGSRHVRAALEADGSLPRSSCALEVMMRLPDDMCDPTEPRRPPRGIRTAIVARLYLSSGRPVGARAKPLLFHVKRDAAAPSLREPTTALNRPPPSATLGSIRRPPCVGRRFT